MRHYWVVIVLAVAAVAAGVAFYTGALRLPSNLAGLGFNGGVCEVDGEIGSSTRAAVDAATDKFAQAMLGGKPETALALMTDAGRAKSLNFAAQLKAYTHNADFTNIHIVHTIYIDNHGTGADTKTLCPGDGHFLSLFLRPGAQQAHIEVAADTVSNGWLLEAWLLQEHGGWRVQYVHIGPSSVAGHDTRDLLTMAKKERDGGHDFNAAMLYTGAVFVADTGPSWVNADLQKELKGVRDSLKTPPELSGPVPFTWTLAGKDYKVSHVTIQGIKKDLGLIIDLPQADWPSDAIGNQRGRDFLTAYTAAHPDYARDFSYLVARTLKPDNSGGYATVYQRGKGLLN
ncbi:MAG: hypothetical protein ACREHE_09270 [Rhizomicrobium sp.]